MRLSVLFPSFHQGDMTAILLNSFEKFCPTNIKINYIVVENSDDVSYKDSVLGISKNITWINNPINIMGSDANGLGIEAGLKYVGGDFVFIAHCDVCVTNTSFFKTMIDKISDGHRLIGTSYDPARIHACTISGCMVDTEIAKKVNYRQVIKNGIQIQDAGDEITVYCRNNSVKNCYLRNSFNDRAVVDLIKEPFRSFQSDRCVDDDNNVIFLHLGRGYLKTQGLYNKPGKTGSDEWINFCNKILRDP